MTRFHICRLLFLFLLLTKVAAGDDWFDDREKTYVAGLRSRQLFGIAEFYCTASLQRSDLTRTDQAALTVELMQNRAAKALIAPPSQRNTAWQTVWQTETEFKSRFPRHPKMLLVSIQTALSRLRYASSIQQELSAEMIPPANVAIADQVMIEQLRNARRTFEQMERDIQKMIPQQRVKSTTDDEFSVEQLAVLLSNVRFQLARCQLQTAYRYDAGDIVNRSSIIGDVLQRIAEVQASVSPQQRIWWLSKITQIECLRLIGRNLDAAQKLNDLPPDDQPSDLTSEILEQRLLLAAATGDVDWATKHLQKSDQNRLFNQTPQMDIAQMKVAIMLSTNADTDADRQRWLDRAAQIVADIDRWHGAYWNRRAGLAMIESLPATEGAWAGAVSEPSAGQREIVIQNAKRATGRGNDDDAVKSWLRAIDLTSVPSDRQPLLINVSKSLERLNRHAEAAKYLFDAANGNPIAESAAAMHLRGCWNLAQESSPASPDHGALQAALQEHLQRWPDQQTSIQAATWLVAEFNEREQFEQAVQTLINRDVVSQIVINQLRATFSAAQRQSAADQTNIQKLAQEIVDHLQQKWSGVEDASIAESLTATAIEIALSSGYLPANEVTRFLNQHDARFPIDARSEIQLYRSLLTAWVEEDLPAAAKILDDLSPTESQCRQILAITQQQQSRNNRVDRIADDYRLLVAEAALRTPLSVQETMAWKFEQAKSLSATGQTKRALAILAPLAQQFRTDVSIQLQYARVLSQSPDHINQSIDAWRKLTQQLKPKSESWYEAKLNVAQGLADSKQPDAAKKILKYVQAVYGWKGSAWADSIERLLRQL